MNTNYLISNNNKKIEGPIVFYPEILRDERGYFFESWNKRNFLKLYGIDINFIQDNQSMSHENVLRGLHFQLYPYAQCKLVRVLNGSVKDVVVDLRLNSPTFSEWSIVELNSITNNQLFIPEGFAHGFLSLIDNTIVQYKVNKYWYPEYERTLRWDDKVIDINWDDKLSQKDKYLISEKDKNGFLLKDLINSNEVFS